MKRKKVTCISLLFIGCGITYFGFDKYNNIKDLNDNELLVMKYFENHSNNEGEIKNISNSNINVNSNYVKKKEYIALLEIPKINFKRGLYKIGSKENNLSKNIIFLDSSDMPDKDNSRVIIAGHSGAPSNAYFKNLYKLNLKETIILYYKNKKYVYKITDIYEITKNGNLALESNKESKTLTLVTCKDDSAQLVIVSTLNKEGEV